VIIVSTDGSCLRNPGGAIGWAWVNHHGPSRSGGERSGTNQIAELRALLEAILAHPGDEPLLIESDSQYAIKCASEWVAGWKKKGWRTSSGDPVKNLDLIRDIDQALADRKGPVRFRWVRGHVGNHYNEEADRLAGEAARAVAATATAAHQPARTTPTTPPATGAATTGSPAKKTRQVRRRPVRPVDPEPALFDLPAESKELTLF
jgi:ribonuclease HI